MLKTLYLIFFLLFISLYSLSQDRYEDSVLTVISKTNNDSIKVLNCLRLAFHFDYNDSVTIKKYLNKATDYAGTDYDLILYVNRNKGFVYRKNYKYEKALEYFRINISLAEKKKDSVNLAFAYDNYAMTYYYDAQYSKAFENFKKSASLYEKNNNLINAGQSYNNAGIMTEIDNNLKEALEYYFKAIKIYEKEKNYRLIAGTAMNIGLIYIRQENFKQAIEHYLSNFHYLDSIDNKGMVADFYSNLGIAYDDDHQYEKAYENFSKTLEIAESINDKKRIALAYTNLGSNCVNRDKFDEAISFNKKALEIKKEISNLSSIAITQIGLGSAYLRKGDYVNANKYLLDGLKNAEATGYKDYIKFAFKELSESYYRKGDYKKSIDYLKEFNLLKDSMLNDENNKAITEMRTLYETEKKEQQIKLQTAEIKTQKLNIIKEKAINEKKTAQRNMFVVGFLLMIILVVIILYFLKQKQKSNKLLKYQKEEISEKNEELNQQNEEITAQRDEIMTQRDMVKEQKDIIEEIHLHLSDSIDYATRIQGAILPDDKSLKNLVSDFFVLFKPKDKVSGDFYWWTTIENTTVITAADCTGHGVPGAFMSMLGISFLREIVQKEYITNSGVILRKLRKEIIKSLKQTVETGSQKDGMDMALVSINHETNLVQFSGANNPLYIVKRGKLKVESEITDSIKLFELDELPNIKLYEVKPNKMPIAIYLKMDNFTTHEIQLEKGDQIYMFSDGYADQFGGAKGKKFKYKPFKRLLLENAHKPMNEQKEILETAFISWKGSSEQIDDVVVLGIKI